MNETWEISVQQHVSIIMDHTEVDGKYGIWVTEVDGKYGIWVKMIQAMVQ